MSRKGKITQKIVCAEITFLNIRYHCAVMLWQWANLYDIAWCHSPYHHNHIKIRYQVNKSLRKEVLSGSLLISGNYVVICSPIPELSNDCSQAPLPGIPGRRL
jgi:hypothetical protein